MKDSLLLEEDGGRRPIPVFTPSRQIFHITYDHSFTSIILEKRNTS